MIWTPKTQDIKEQESWIQSEIDSITEESLKSLVSKAVEARSLSYSPYSGYKVGATVLTTSGEVFTGQNIEIASYSETGHAEEQALKNAVSAGSAQKGRKFVRAIAISHEGDTAPCGRCRQIISEFCDNCVIVVANDVGKINSVTSLNLIFPYSFSPTDLGK